VIVSQPNSVENPVGEAVQKQKLSIYTMMLLIAFLAITTACLLLYLELRRWGSFPWWKTQGVMTTSYHFEQHTPELPNLASADPVQRMLA
jgi:hypothetical protein